MYPVLRGQGPRPEHRGRLTADDLRQVRLLSRAHARMTRHAWEYVRRRVVVGSWLATDLTIRPEVASEVREDPRLREEITEMAKRIRREVYPVLFFPSSRLNLRE